MNIGHNNPRCPNGIIARKCCVTQKCNACPFMCESKTNPSYSCSCMNAHKYCKVMDWSSVLSLLADYQQNLPETLKCFIKRMQKIYNNIIMKVNTQLKIFHQFVQQKLYGTQYAKIMHYIQKEQFHNITCNSLGSIISIMTERIVDNRTHNAQEGKTNIQKFSLNQMKVLDGQIGCLFKNIEGLYKNKYHVIQKELRQINNKQRRSYSSSSLNKTMSSSDCSYNASTFSNANESYKNILMSKTNSFPQNQSNIRLSQSNVTLKRSESLHKNVYGTTSTFFYTNSKQQFLRQSQLASTKQSKFNNPQLQFGSVLKIDLTYPKSINSRIIANASILNHLIMNKISQYKLIYRASQNNYQLSQFYRKIANHTFNQQNIKKIYEQYHPMTLLLVKTEFGKVIGGYTKLKWSLLNNYTNDQQQQDVETGKSKCSYKQDIRGTSNLFSVDLNQRYQLKQPQYAIYCSSKGIGFGKNDLRIINHCHKHSKNYIGFPNSYNNGLYLPVKKSSLLLSGSHGSSHFKITQWQMFEVILKDQKNKTNGFHYSEGMKMGELQKKKSMN